MLHKTTTITIIIQGIIMTRMIKTIKGMTTVDTSIDTPLTNVEDFQVEVDALGIRKIYHVNLSNATRA